MIIFTFHYAYFLPLFLGAWRWGAYFILKIIPSMFYKARPISDVVRKGEVPVSLDMVTLVSPIFQPEPGFIDCLKSWIKNEPHKIILAVDVCSYENVLNMVNELDHNGIGIDVLKITEPGKRVAMYAGLQFVTTELIVFLDDDALYPPTLLKSLIQPFKDPMMGGCGTKQIARPKGDDWCIWDIMMDMSVYQRTVQNKATTVMGGGSSCISGRTMCFRTALFQTDDFREKFLNERFFHSLQLSGDDKCLTRICINSDYKMTHQSCKECTLSTQFESGKKLLQQQLRWSRNTWRSDLKLLFVERKVWRKYPWLAIVLIDKILSPFSMLAGPIIILCYTIIYKNLFAIVGFLIYVTITRSLKAIMYFRTRPRRPLKWIIYIPVHIIFQYVGAIIRIWALFTLRNRKWGNRSVKVKGNQVVRTGEFKNVKIETSEDIKLEDPNNVKIETPEDIKLEDPNNVKIETSEDIKLEDPNNVKIETPEDIKLENSITWDIVKNNPDKPWDWKALSSNPNITWDIVKNNPNKPWNWKALSSNPNITWDIVELSEDIVLEDSKNVKIETPKDVVLGTGNEYTL